ncbi:hypothetical protein ACSBR2_036801 [Camellia fascicularis]
MPSIARKVIVAMDRGPTDPTVLTLQQSHRSALAWTASRWRSETHTFHLTSGEATITLQDVSILSGLRVDGNAVIGNSGYDWPAVCNCLLGTVPPTNQLKGLRLNMTWLSQTCGNLPIDADDVTIQRYARAFILQLLGGSIFAGKSGNMVQLMFLPLQEDFDAIGEYSWGSAALAWLYRELCRASHERMHDISGFLILVQIWVLWRPYSTELIEGLPPFCSDGADIWQAIVPLIYFFIVEMYHPDRVQRQFGFWQTIPYDCDTVTALHDLNLCGTKTKDWVKHHKEWIQLWDQRRTRIAIGEPWDGDMHDDDPYMSGHLLQICNVSLEGSHMSKITSQGYLHHSLTFMHMQRHNHLMG